MSDREPIRLKDDPEALKALKLQNKLAIENIKAGTNQEILAEPEEDVIEVVVPEPPVISYEEIKWYERVSEFTRNESAAQEAALALARQKLRQERAEAVRARRKNTEQNWDAISGMAQSAKGLLRKVADALNKPYEDPKDTF